MNDVTLHTPCAPDIELRAAQEGAHMKRMLELCVDLLIETSKFLPVLADKPSSRSSMGMAHFRLGENFHESCPSLFALVCLPGNYGIRQVLARKKKTKRTIRMSRLMLIIIHQTFHWVQATDLQSSGSMIKACSAAWRHTGSLFSPASILQLPSARAIKV